MTNYQVLTPTGWSDFDYVRRTFSDDFIEIHTDVGSLKCTKNHLLETISGEFIEAQNSLGVEIISKIGTDKVISIYPSESDYAYDLTEVKENNKYYTNDLVSHNCSFIGSSGTLIAGWKLKELVARTPLEIKDGSFQYKKPEKDHVYVISADVSHGKGLDYQACHVIDVTTMPYEQVFVYHNNKTAPTEYAEVLMRIGKLYNKADILVENNDMGALVVNSLIADLEYENVLCTKNMGADGKQITNSASGGGERGVKTTKTVKAVGCSMLKLLVEQNQLIINDENTKFELSTFIKKKNTYKADEGKHDDLAMGLVLFGWMSDQKYFKEITDINTFKGLRDKTEEEVIDDLSAFGLPNDDPAIGIDDIAELGWAYSEDVDWLFR